MHLSARHHQPVFFFPFVFFIYGDFHKDGIRWVLQKWIFAIMNKSYYKWMIGGGSLTLGNLYWHVYFWDLAQTWPTESSSRGSCRDPRLEEILSQPGSPERPRSNRIQGVLAWIVESTVFECVTGGRRWDSRFGIRSTPIIADHHHYIYNII